MCLEFRASRALPRGRALLIEGVETTASSTETHGERGTLAAGEWSIAPSKMGEGDLEGDLQRLTAGPKRLFSSVTAFCREPLCVRGFPLGEGLKQEVAQMRTMIGIAAAAIGLALAPTTQAAAMLGGGGCASDLTLSSGSSLVNCYGRIDNNVLNNAHNTEINAALSSLGYSGPAISFNTIPQSNILDPLNGSTTIDFPGTLNGTVFFGVHFGNGQGGPGNTTTFYRLLASNLDTIGLNLNASSNAVLLAAIPAVPEPTTWVLMLAGLGWIGMALRRGRTAKLRVSYGS